MTSTSYRFDDYAKAINRALLHVKVDGKWTAKHTRQPDAQAPAGGASSTINDLTRWMRLQLREGKVDGKQVVAAAALNDTHTPQIILQFDASKGRVAGYGLGWNVSVERGDRLFLRHSGAFSLGMRSEVAVVPSEELAITVLSNAAPSGIPEGLTESFFDWVLDGNLQRDWVEFANRMFEEQEEREQGEQPDYSQQPTDPTPPLALTAYAGKFSNAYFGPIEVAEKKGNLVLRLGPKPMELELRHWNRDIFTYQPVGEMAGKRSGVRFSVAADGKADRVLIDNLDVHGLGTFLRTK
jgi:CubicO group peptidase (beta-lactamase class C family)